MNIIINILSIFVGYLICGFLWSLVEWRIILGVAKQRYNNRSNPVMGIDAFVPDKVSRERMLRLAMVAWPVKFLQFTIYNLTNRAFVLLYKITKSVYDKMIEMVM